MKYILALALIGACLAFDFDLKGKTTTAPPPQANCSKAVPCDPTACVKPDCSCSGLGYSNSTDKNLMPQIVYLTYDDALTAYADEKFYRQLYENNPNLKNPDGCDIRATHFLTAQYTDFSLVHEYWEKGHEMGAHSITHRSKIDYWKKLNKEGWEEEINGMRSMAAQFANIPFEQIIGARAPFLQGGGNEMYQMLWENDFLYDCSWPSRQFGYTNLENGLFPYTLDYRSIQDCPIEPCVDCSFPGLWVQPMLDLEDSWFGSNPQKPDVGQPCSMLDGCIIIEDGADETDVFDMLNRNFERVYNGNRAPFGLYMHAGWFFGENAWHFEGYKMFLESIAAKDDVWIVPIKDGIEFYSKYSNYTNDDVLAMDPFENPLSCFKNQNDPEVLNRDCGQPQACRFTNVTHPEDGIVGQERYMTICTNKAGNVAQNCPPEDRYPWLGDPCGGNVPCQSTI